MIQVSNGRFLKRYYNIKIKETIIEDQENMTNVVMKMGCKIGCEVFKIVHGKYLT